MAQKYRIGKFEFDTYEEYVRGKVDVNKIRKITQSVNIYDPDTALRLYQSIRSKKIKFYSKIGRQFFLDLADILADNAGAESKKKKELLDKQQKKAKHIDRSQMILGGICLVAAIVCFAWYFWSDYTNYRGDKVNDYLRQLKEEPQESADMISNDTLFLESSPELAAAAEDLEAEQQSAEASQQNDVQQGATQQGSVQTNTQLEILSEYSAIYQQNRKFGGWITIEGTKVDYPVMLTKGDTEYYLDHNFSGQEDINGTLFMDPRTNLTERSTNIIIYGHNMKSGAMFGGLKDYLKESYYNSHKQITFDTIYEKGTYEIFAVCLAQVQYRNSDGFRYYDFIQADSEEDFQDFLQNIVQLSVFVDEELPVYGDELLTLSTCNDFAEDGRLFLVARKCRDAE